MTDTRIPTLTELRQWGRERLESQLANARFLAMHGTSKPERAQHAKRAAVIAAALGEIDVLERACGATVSAADS